MRKALLELAIERSIRELNTHPEYDNFMHWCYLVDKQNKIVSVGVNQGVTPDQIYGYHINESFSPKLHAELHAVKKCKVNLRDCVAINVRLSKKGLLRMAAPCKACRKILWLVGIKRCWYTHEFGWGNLIF